LYIIQFYHEFMNWYNFIRSHGAFDIEKLETPAVIYYERLPKKEIIDQSFFDMLDRGCNNLGIKLAIFSRRIIYKGFR